MFDILKVHSQAISCTHPLSVILDHAGMFHHSNSESCSEMLTSNICVLAMNYTAARNVPIL